MTNATEAKLAREAEICYATIALPTDYDCWHEAEEDVTVEAVIQRLNEGTGKARRIIRAALALLDQAGPCHCRSALASAILTDRTRIPEATKQRLAPIVAKYL
jgi:5'-methylthioadenosine phosphorylase